MKKSNLLPLFFFLSLFFAATPVLAYVMSSTNYRIDSDSVNFGGGLQTSASYGLESAIGEQGTGYISSGSYFGSIGYLQASTSTSATTTPICNNNGTCEGDRGENASNCPNDCDGGIIIIIPPTTTPPTTTEDFIISNVRTQAVTTSSAEILWATNRSAVCGLSWGLTTDYLGGSLAGLSYLSDHSSRISGLQASSTYHYKIFCQDASGSSTQSVDYSFLTLSGLDRIPPGNVIGLRVSAGNQRNSLFWINPSDEDFAGVVIRRSTNNYPTLNSGIKIYDGLGSAAANGERTLNDIGLINGTWYYYAAFAYDRSGNFASGALGAGLPFESTGTPPISTTTPPEPPTTTLPIVGDLLFRDFDFFQDDVRIAVNDDQADGGVGKNVFISLAKSKVLPGTDRMIIYLSNKGGLETYSFGYNQSDGTYSLSLPTPLEPGRYGVTITVLDSRGGRIKDVKGWIELSEARERELISSSTIAVVQASIGAISDIVRPLREIAESPAGNVAAGAVVGVSIINLGLAVPWWNWYFLQFLFTQPWALISSKKRKGWGTVYNSITKKPIDLALVRLYDAETKQLVKSRVTDVDGRYIFLVDEGRYYLQAQKPGFDFPSALLRGAGEDSNFVDLYYGEEFSVGAGQKGVISANIPMDQQEIKLSDKQILKKHFKFRNLWRLSYLGPIFAIAYFAVYPSVFAGILAVLHLALLLLFKRLAEWKKPKSWGRIYDKKNNKPLSKAIARVFSPEYDRMLEFYVTDNRGRYGFLAGSNKYYVTADKDGYSTTKTEIIDLSGKKTEETVIAKDLGLDKDLGQLSQVDAGSIAPSGQQSLEGVAEEAGEEKEGESPENKNEKPPQSPSESIFG